MALVEPVPGEPAAIANLDGRPDTGGDGDGERALVVADYHAGVESALRYDGVELESRAGERRAHVLDLLERTGAGRVVFLGDLAHWIGRPDGAELEEIVDLLDAVSARVPVTLVKGNHDGDIEDAVSVPVTDAAGARLGAVGFAHGHTWPSSEVLGAPAVCVGHEHPMVRLEDAVGGRRVERVWLRGRLAPEAFDAPVTGELVVFPAFNQLVGGTWINVEDQEFLSPFLPDGLADGEAYLLDGTRLGAYAEL